MVAITSAVNAYSIELLSSQLLNISTSLFSKILHKAFHINQSALMKPMSCQILFDYALVKYFETFYYIKAY